MVRFMREQRATGVLDFDTAWRRASNRCRLLGKPRPRDFNRAPQNDDEGWLPYSTFFRAACRRYWNGYELDVAGLPDLLLHLADAQLERHEVGDLRAHLIA